MVEMESQPRHSQSSPAPTASIRETAQENMLNTMEAERRMQLGRGVAKPIGALMTIGAGLVLILWLLHPAYTQLLIYIGLLLLPAGIAWMRPVFEARGRLALWNNLFGFSASTLAFLVPLLVPDALLAMAIGHVLIFLFIGLIQGSAYVLKMILLVIPAFVLDILIGRQVEERWFVPLDATTRAVVVPMLAGFLLFLAAVIVHVILREQERLYRQAQRATLDSEQAKAAAELASQAKSRLLAKVSHELRTPLGGVLGYAELLRDEALGPTNEEQRYAAEEIVTSAQYLTTLVSELLDAAQMEASSVVLRKTVFSPARFLQQAMAGVAVQVRHRGLALRTQIDPDLPPTLSGDEHRLKQILFNLVGNAIKFTPTGEVSVTLARRSHTHWLMQVADTGIGISHEAQAYIFEPFRQAGNSLLGDSRGVGLGLSITRQLVELMGGEITVDSEVGRGSTFCVVLPLEA